VTFQKSLVPFIDLQWFAAEDEGRTEQPTEHKLRKAREEGRVPKSQDLNSALVILLAVIALVILAPWLFRNCLETLVYFFSRAGTASFTETGIPQGAFLYIVKMTLPITLTALAGGVAANLIQNRGFIFTFKPLEFKASKIVPRFGEYFRRTIFSAQGAFNVAKSLVKVVVLGAVAYALIRGNMEKLLSVLTVSLWNAVSYIAWMAAKLLLIASVVFLVLSIPDYFMQRYQFVEQMKMTRQEVKQEYKELEGDPQVKGQLRQQMQSLMTRNMRESVAKSDVVITNPTHFAVAVQYDRAVMDGPTVMAKGQDYLAARIREIALENNVPLVENVPLARALYAEVEVGQVIPEAYYQALAIILAKVYNVDEGASSTFSGKK
jgi:flagellar biosynthetic protein FlhB